MATPGAMATPTFRCVHGGLGHERQSLRSVVWAKGICHN